MSCKTLCCKFKNKHVTRYHLCNKCYNYGHGEIECNNIYYKNNLIKYWNDELAPENYCSFGGCELKKYHTTEDHKCTICYENLHSNNTCNQYLNDIEFKIKCPLCRKINLFTSNQIKIPGLNEKCCICLSNNIEIYFPSCGHICICNKCCNIMNLNTMSIINEIELIHKNFNINKIKSYLKKYPSYLLIKKNNNDFIIIRRLYANDNIEGLNINFFDRYNYEKQENVNFIIGYSNTYIKLKLEEIIYYL